MSRICSQCRTKKANEAYSKAELSKGDDVSRCRGCVAGYRCGECRNSFDHPNHLEMHMQIHRPRTVACPLCGEGRHFRSDANAVQHIECGFCSGCQGKTNHLEQLVRFAARRRAMKPYISYKDPEFPYVCHCSRTFKQLGQFLQHQDNKHSLHPLRIKNFKLV